MTDEPTTPEPGADAADDLPGMPVPPPLDGSMEPMAPQAKEPSRTWIWVTAAIVAVVMAGVGVLSLTGGGDSTSSATGDSQRFSAHGVAFDYPAGWQDLGPASFEVNSGDVQWSESFGLEAGANGAIVTEYALKKDVSSVSQEALQAELDQLFASTVAQAGGELTRPISPTTVNGIPAYEVSFTSTTGGADLTTDMVLVFDGTQQWNIQCQYAAADQPDVLPGCQQIWDSFTIEG
jgi:hypothetical protein